MLELEMAAVNGELTNRCPCGGLLALVNMDDHLAAVPRAAKPLP